ncbi:MAG: hypothetical protein AAB502_00470, partial [Chloroflexota bacterium]
MQPQGLVVGVLPRLDALRDGLIALANDDAGPTLSGLVNDLLLACYGPRFTVASETLQETAKGEIVTELAFGRSYAREVGVEHNVVNPNPHEFVFVEI